MTTQTIRSGTSIDVPILTGQTLKVVAVSGTYTITVIRGTGIGTALATAATGGSYGTYAYDSLVRIVASADSEIDYDVAVSPVVSSDTVPSLAFDSSGNVTGLVGQGGKYYPLNLDGGPNTIIIAGDSLARNYSQVPTSTFAAVQSSGVFALANALGENRFNVLSVAAVGGKLASEVLTEQIPTVVAARPKYCYISCGVNDLYIGLAAGDVVANRVIACIQALLLGGVIPIWSTIWARSSGGGTTDDHIWCNDLLRKFAASNPCGIFFDGYKATQTPGTATFGIRSGWTYDSSPNLHINNLGAYWLGKAMFKAFDALVPKISTLAVGVEDQTNSTNNKSNILVNPFFAGTAGTVSANCTGTMPDSWTIDWATRTGTGSAAASIVDVLDPDTGLATAKGIQVVLSGTPASGDVLRISQATGFNTLLSAGDNFSCQGVVSLVNPAYTQSVAIRTQTNGNESTWWGVNSPATSGSGTYESYPESCTFTCETGAIAVLGAGAASAARYDLRITYNGAATGTFVFSRPRVRKV